MSASTSFPTEGPLRPPEGFCPKCVTPRTPEKNDCVRCGLVFARVKEEVSDLPQWLLDAWKEAWVDWENLSKHETLCQTAQEVGELTALARLYRVALAWKPGDAQAQRGIEEVMRRAVTSFQQESPPGISLSTAEKFRKTLTVAVAGVLILASAWALFAWVLPR